MMVRFTVTNHSGSTIRQLTLNVFRWLAEDGWMVFRSVVSEVRKFAHSFMTNIAIYEVGQ